MTIDRRMLGILASLLLAAACGGPATPAPATAPAATETPAATAEASPTQALATSQPSVEIPSFSPGPAGDLEAMLPSDVNGVAFTRTSLNYANLPASIPLGDLKIDEFLSANGKTLNDVRFAIATSSDSAAMGTTVLAIQIQGLSSDKVTEWALGGIAAGGTKTTVGGKSVYSTQVPGMYLYVKGDIAFMVLAPAAPQLGAAVVQALP